ncbi:DUF6397 family protein [Streptomyces sp. NPDC046832]|uniref:DUF6397 family protein n=1 Tax=Streptomyces sp. NPDC046832 TaxID=3155020 RepID=UPI0033E2EC45
MARTSTSTSTTTTPDRRACVPSRAARELELRRRELDLAVNLGLIRTVPDEGGGGRCVARAEIDRLRSGEGFPEALRERVATVGTTEGAQAGHGEMRRTLRSSVTAGCVPPRDSWLTGHRDDRDPRCPRCGTQLRRSRMAGRGTVWCPRCQPER